MKQPGPAPRQPPKLSAPAAPDRLGGFDDVLFTREKLAPCLRELAPLIEADWREAGSNHNKIPLDINWQRYLDYDLVGILHLVTARDDKILIGYIFNFVSDHILHAATKWCMIDLYWLYPQYRGQGVGRAMLEANEKLLRGLGVQMIQASERTAVRHGLFARSGYSEAGTVWRKLLT